MAATTKCPYCGTYYEGVAGCPICRRPARDRSVSGAGAGKADPVASDRTARHEVSAATRPAVGASATAVRCPECGTYHPGGEDCPVCGEAPDDDASGGSAAGGAPEAPTSGVATSQLAAGVAPDRLLVAMRFGVEQEPASAAHLVRLLGSGELSPDARVRDTEGGEWFPARELLGPRAAARAPRTTLTSSRSFATTLTLVILLGALGAHWYYLGRRGLGTARLLTWTAVMGVNIGSRSASDLGTAFTMAAVATLLAVGIAVWTLVDIVLVASRGVRDDQGLTLG